MISPMRSLLRRGLLTALAVLFAVSAQSQDRPARLIEALDLSDTQARLVTETFADAELGDLWTLAAALTPTLTEEQREKLFSRPARTHGYGEQRLRNRRGDVRDLRRSKPEDRDERAETVALAMRDALGLSAAQVEQLETLHAKRRAEREARRAERPEPGAVRADLAAILTPEQQQVAAVHEALAVYFARARSGRQARDGQESGTPDRR